MNPRFLLRRVPYTTVKGRLTPALMVPLKTTSR